MEKAIYGMAMPFNDFYTESDSEKNTYSVDMTNHDAVFFDSKVGITLGHNYFQVFGTTEDGLQIQLTDAGVFFKLTPNCPLGWSVYKKVKRAALRHCSISYRRILTEPNVTKERAVTEAFRSAGHTDEISVNDLREITVFEVCLTNGPANKLTFCTTNVDDPRLKGLSWDNIQPIPKALIRPIEQGGFDHKIWMAQEIETLSREVAELKKDFQKINRLGGRK